jgi:hypothetical protein
MNRIPCLPSFSSRISNRPLAGEGLTDFTVAPVFLRRSAASFSLNLWQAMQSPPHPSLAMAKDGETMVTVTARAMRNSFNMLNPFWSVDTAEV